jgi:hypothetical protein
MFGRYRHLERMYIMTFSLDIKEFAEKTKRNVNDVKQAAAIELFGMIIKATPVGNPSLWKSPPPPGYVGGRVARQLASVIKFANQKRNQHNRFWRQRHN